MAESNDADASLGADTLSAEARRIVALAQSEGCLLRLTGSIAVQIRCPSFGVLARTGRSFRDIDFAAYKKGAKPIQRILTNLGYAEDREVAVVSEGARSIFDNPATLLHIDVFYDRLDFCHVIGLDGRLEAEEPTLPLAELLLSKLQIVKINEKDLLDGLVLLLEHPLDEVDSGGINGKRMARLCAEDWGLWRTVSINLEKLEGFARDLAGIESAQRARLTSQIGALRARLDVEPKPLAWRMRAKVGDRLKWYKDVDEVA